MKVAVDIETNVPPTLIHECCLVTEVGDYVCKSPEELIAALTDLLRKYKESLTLYTWNGIKFDLPMLDELWGVDLSGYEHMDGYVLSRLFDPVRATGHSLSSYGKEMGYEKLDFTDYNEPAEGETVDEWNERRIKYCLRDCGVTIRAVDSLLSRLEAERFKPECIQLEHDVCRILARQQRHGFL